MGAEKPGSLLLGSTEPGQGQGLCSWSREAGAEGEGEFLVVVAEGEGCSASARLLTGGSGAGLRITQPLVYLLFGLSSYPEGS